MRKNKWLWRTTGFSIAYLALMALTPDTWTNIPAVALAVLCLIYITLFAMANWKGRRK